MHRFHCDERRYAARERTTGATGELLCSTRVTLRGNPTKGPIPVEVTYIVSFRLDEASRSPEEDRYRFSGRQFESDEERKLWLDDLFETDFRPLDDFELASPERYSVAVGRSAGGGSSVEVIHVPTGRRRGIKSAGSLPVQAVAAVLARQLEEDEADGRPHFPKSRPVEVVPHTPSWPDEFQTVAAELGDFFGDLALRIDHIGSTSVPGLPAKDIIDVQVTVASVDDERLATVIENGPYRTRADIVSDSFVGLPDDSPDLRKRFIGERDGQRRIHVHLRERGRFNQRYALLFRDFLRATPPAATAYAVMKERLAALFPDSIDGYLYIKDPLMDLIYVTAETWATATGWQVPERRAEE